MEHDITIYLATAVERFLSAERKCATGRSKSGANWCSDACFQAVIAALLREDIRPRSQWRHAFVQAQFVGQLVNRRKRYDAGLRRVLSDNQSLRDKADYRPELVSQIQASRALSRSRTCVHAVRQGGGIVR